MVEREGGEKGEVKVLGYNEHIPEHAFGVKHHDGPNKP